MKLGGTIWHKVELTLVRSLVWRTWHQRLWRGTPVALRAAMLNLLLGTNALRLLYVWALLRLLLFCKIGGLRFSRLLLL